MEAKLFNRVESLFSMAQVIPILLVIIVGLYHISEKKIETSVVSLMAQV